MSTTSFRPLVALPANLTVQFDSEALTTADPRAWCEQRAVGLLGEGAGGRDVRRLADSLEEHLDFFKTQLPLICAAVCFFPDYATLPPRATVRVQAFGGDRAMTFEEIREIYAQSADVTAGETELTESELPAGPAMRVHRFVKADPGKRRSALMEEIVWLVCPPGHPVTVAISVRWVQPVFRKAGYVIADEMAQNFRVGEPGGS